MPHGAPDFGIRGTAELRGETAWMDDFSTGMSAWNRTVGGVGGLIEASPTHTLSKGYAARITVGTGLPGYSHIEHYMQRPKLGMYGLEASFTIHANHTYFMFYFYHHNGARRQQWMLNYYPALTQLFYVDHLGVEVGLLPLFDLYQDWDTFHTLKLVVDPDKLEYCWCTLDDVVYDLSGIANGSTASGLTPHMTVHIGYGTNQLNIVHAYVDDVIVTQKEQ